jgi:hypothetical protein
MGKDLVQDLNTNETKTEYILRNRSEANLQEKRKEERKVYLMNSRQKQANRKASKTPPNKNPNKTRSKSPNKNAMNTTPPKTPTRIGKTPKKKISVTKSPIFEERQLLQMKMTPTKEMIVIKEFASFKMSGGPLSQKEKEGHVEEVYQSEEILNEIITEKEDQKITIQRFLEKKIKETTIPLDWKKIRFSKLYILYSTKYEWLSGILKEILDTLYQLSGGEEEEEPFVDSSPYNQDQEDTFVVKIREPKLKSKRTVLSTCEHHHIFSNESDLSGTLQFLFSEVVLKSFLPESKKIPGRLND